MSQPEVLFGAPNRTLSEITLTLLTRSDGGYSVVVVAQPASRQHAMRLHVNCTAEQTPGGVLGQVQPLLHRWFLSPGSWRRQASLVANRLGADGYEVCLS